MIGLGNTAKCKGLTEPTNLVGSTQLQPVKKKYNFNCDDLFPLSEI